MTIPDLQDKIRICQCGDDFAVEVHAANAIYTATFSGLGASDRAKDYAHWLNSLRTMWFGLEFEG